MEDHDIGVVRLAALYEELEHLRTYRYRIPHWVYEREEESLLRAIALTKGLVYEG